MQKYAFYGFNFLWILTKYAVFNLLDHNSYLICCDHHENIIVLCIGGIRMPSYRLNRKMTDSQSSYHIYRFVYNIDYKIHLCLYMTTRKALA